MTTTVGAVDVKFTGDASGAVSAAKTTAQAIDGLDKKTDALKDSTDAAAAAARAATAALAGEGDAAKRASDALNGVSTSGKKAAKASEEIAATTKPIAERANKAAEAIGKMRGGYAALAGTVGSAIPVVNNATGALQALVASFGVGGALGLAATGVAVGITAMISAMQSEEEAHRKAADAANKHRAVLGDLQAQIDGVGKSAVEQARLLAGAKAATATQDYLGSDEGAQSVRDELRLRSKLVELNENLERTGNQYVHAATLDVEKQLSSVLRDRRNAIDAINSAYAKTVELAEVKDAEDKRNKSLEKTKKHLEEIRAEWEKLNEKARAPTMGDAGLAGFGPTGGIASMLPQGLGMNAATMQALDLSGIAAMAKASEHAAGVMTVAFDDLEREIAKLTDTSEIVVDHGFAVDMATISIEDLNAEVRELEGEFYDVSHEVSTFKDRLGKHADNIANFARSVASGSMFSEVGSTLGNVIGTAMYGAVGGAIGGLIGGILGGTADELANALGMVTPLFDGLGLVIGSLQPIFVVIRETFAALMPVWAQLAVLVLQIARILAAWMVPLVRLVQVVALVVAGLLTLVNGVMNFASVLVVLAHNIDLAVGQRVVLAMESFYNALVMMVNALVDSVRRMPGFSEFGVKMDTIDIETGSIIDMFAQDFLIPAFEEIGLVDVLAENTAAVEENTRAYSFSTTNIPAGYKTAFALYNAETPAPNFSNAGLGLASGGIFAGATINVYANNGSELVVQTLKSARKWGRMSGGAGTNGGGN